MASTFSTDLKIELMATGENSGTWGTKTNTNLDLVQQAIVGFENIAITSTNTTLLMTDATISSARNAVLRFTGTITANCTVFVESGIEKTYILENATSGAFTLALNQVGGASAIFGTTDKSSKLVYLNGTDAVDLGIVNLQGTQTLTNKTLTSPKIGTSILDTNGNELALLTATASAVNEITLANAAANNSPTISATGSDTNVGINLTPKGTGGIVLPAGAVGTPALTTSGDLNTGIFFPSADTIAFTEGGSEAMRIDSDGDVGINTTSPDTKLHVKGTSDTVAPIQVQGNAENGTNLFCDRLSSTESFVNLGIQYSGAGMVLGSFVKPSTTSNNNATGYISSWGSTSVKRASIVVDGSNGIIKFLNTDTSATVAVNTAVAMSERMRIDSSGNLFVGKTASSEAVVGSEILGVGLGVFVRSAEKPMVMNRLVDDGTLVEFKQANAVEGTISVSGNTVSYNGFTGSHWSRFIDESKPDVLRGTVLESLDQMTDWYNAEFETSYTEQDKDGNDVVKTVTNKKPYALKANEQEGDVITYNWNTEKKDEEGNDIIEQVQATIVKEVDVKHVMSKISDTVEAKNVYGVFHAWDNDDLINNDFYVASVGSYVVRIKAGQTVSKGDLLQSNGDGTAKVQADDIIRASTFAKVLSNTVIDTYEDGSFIVPCSLMC